MQHKEPDRVPVDLGGMESTSITAIAYNRLRKYLGLKEGKTRMLEVLQQVVEVEAEVLERIGADVVPVAVGAKNGRNLF